MSDDVVRILSIDGGGIRGIIPAMVLQALLKDRNAQDVFHLVAGTSTGGIIACGLAKPQPMTLTEITDLYVEHGAEIFNPVSGSGGILGPKYSPAALMKYLGDEFEKTHLSDINASGDKAELLIPSYAIGLPKENPPGNTCMPMFFRSWEARGLLLEGGATAAESDFRLSAVARATSAAPTYFPPQPLLNKAGQEIHNDRRRRVRQQSRDVRHCRGAQALRCAKIFGCLDRHRQPTHTHRRQRGSDVGRPAMVAPNYDDLYGRQFADHVCRSRRTSRGKPLAI